MSFRIRPRSNICQVSTSSRVTYDISGNILSNAKLVKLTNENQLSSIGDSLTCYFLNVSGNKYLKAWNGTSYYNTNKFSDIYRDCYATFANINTSIYSNSFVDIVVIEDENNNNGIGKYFWNGTTLQEYFML